MREFYRRLEYWKTQSFDWETANCCHFVADMIKARTGRVIEVPHFPDPQAAAQWFKENGGSMYHYLVKLFGRPVAPLQARRGDVAYKAEGIGGPSVGIVDRDALFLSDNGLIHFPLTKCKWVFRG